MQTVLQSDKDITAVLGTGQNFERWIKHGSTADDLINNSADSEEPPPSKLLPAVAFSSSSLLQAHVTLLTVLASVISMPAAISGS